MQQLLDNPIILLLAVAVATLGTGRIVRLVTHDDFPPSEWVRDKWEYLTVYKFPKLKDWNKLLNCFWCFSPWAMIPTMAWGLLSDFHWSWWVFYGWLGISYLTSMLVARDEPR